MTDWTASEADQTDAARTQLKDVGRSLLGVIEQVEHQVAASLKEAEEQARQITDKAERRVEELETQRSDLYQQISQVRVGDLLGLVREAQAEAIAKAEAAAMWQARAEMLAAELIKVRAELPDGQGQRTQALGDAATSGARADSSDESYDADSAADEEALLAKDSHITALQSLLERQQEQLASAQAQQEIVLERLRDSQTRASQDRARADSLEREISKPWWARLRPRT